MAEFWKQVLETKPDLDFVYFSPSKKTNLRCKINSDGSISALSAPDLRFNKASTLAEAWKSGAVLDENGRKLSPKIKTTILSAKTDFFFKPNRKQRVYDVIQASQRVRQNKDPSSNCQDKSVDKESEPSNVDQPLVHLEIEQPNNANTSNLYVGPILMIIGTESFEQNQSAEDDSVQKPLDIMDLERRKKPCPGFSRVEFLDVIEDRKWDGDRMEFSPLRLGRDHCWSKKCDLEIASTRRICVECQKSIAVCKNRQRRIDKTPSSEERRIRHSSCRWLSRSDLEKKLEVAMDRKKKADGLLRKRNRRIKSLTK